MNKCEKSGCDANVYSEELVILASTMARLCPAHRRKLDAAVAPMFKRLSAAKTELLIAETAIRRDSSGADELRKRSAEMADVAEEARALVADWLATP